MILARILSGVMAVLAIWPACALAQSTSTQRSTSTQTIIDSLRGLVAHSNLELSTTENSASKNFVVELIISGVSESRSASILVVRNNDRVAIVVRDYPGGGCRCYITNGLTLVVNHADPGEVLCFKSDFPSLDLVDQNGEIDFRLAFQTGDAAPKVGIDLGGIITDILKITLDGSFDPKTRAYTLRGSENTCRLFLFPSDLSDPFPVKALQIEGFLSFEVYEKEMIPDSITSLFRDPDETLSILRSLNVRLNDQVRAPSPENKLLYTIPMDTGEDPKEMSVNLKLCSVVLGGCTIPTDQRATTRPFDIYARGVVKELTRRLSDAGTAEFCNRPNSSAKQFCITSEYLTQNSSGSRSLSTVTVMRDQDHVAVSIFGRENSPRGGQGDLYAVATNGLILQLDTENPGGIVRVKGGSPDVMLTLNPDSKHTNAVFRVVQGSVPTVLFEFGGIARALTAQATWITHFAGRDIYFLVTPQSTAIIHFAEPSEIYPFTLYGLAIQTDDSELLVTAKALPNQFNWDAWSKPDLSHIKVPIRDMPMGDHSIDLLPQAGTFDLSANVRASKALSTFLRNPPNPVDGQN
jgi:hypothetical protein